MSSSTLDRDQLLSTVGGQLGRDLSTWTVLFHTAVAERVGLGATEHKALGLIEQRGPITAGELAELTGLTTGAITNVIDRLERAGHVQRTKDPHDRRKVVLVALPSAARDAEYNRIFASLAQAMMTLCARYSDAELRVINDFMAASIGVLQQEITRMRAEPVPERSAGS